MSDLTPLEQAVMEKLLVGDDDILSLLRDQLRMSSVANREMTGVGFYTKFVIPHGAPMVPEGRTFKFGDVIAKIAELKFGAGFLLFVKAGVLYMLEAYSYDEPWPQAISDFELSYTTGEMRDMDHLRRIFHVGRVGS